MQSGPSGESNKILIVEDEAALLRITAHLLTAAGYDVLTATDGQRASALLAEHTFDVIVSDIAMPNMNGIKLLQAIRARDLDVPVILMTGVPDLKTAAQAVEHGAFLYLRKPVDQAELEQAIAKAVRLNQVGKVKREALLLVSNGGLGSAERVALEASFQRACATLSVAYQPIVGAGDRRLFGYEVLLRSQEQSLPNPGAVLDAAERLGRLEDLGRKIRSLAALGLAGAAPGSVFFVNLHPRDLMDDALRSPSAPLSALAHRVILEITERASLDGVDDLRSIIPELRSLGFRIAIDDLGAGYAGLASFATLEPEFVKLDMSLIRGIDKSSVKERLVRSLTKLCKELGMQVVAEGVETAEERDVIVGLGCDFLQGYLLAKPSNPFPTFSW